jgi:hypothetical protein
LAGGQGDSVPRIALSYIESLARPTVRAWAIQQVADRRTNSASRSHLP